MDSDGNVATTRSPSASPDERLKKIIQAFEDRTHVDAGEIKWLINLTKQMLKLETPLLKILPPIAICGDLHGHFDDLLELFNLNGWPPKKRYLFLGDYVDRGPDSVSTIGLLLALKVRHPGSVYLLRGNHETINVNRHCGFYEDVLGKYNKATYTAFNDMFEWLPVAALVAGNILGVHAGISPFLRSLKDIEDLERPLTFSHSECLLTDLLWGDPEASTRGNYFTVYEESPITCSGSLLCSPSATPGWFSGFSPSNRGISNLFGPDAVEEACQRLKLLMIVRGHQVVPNGFEWFSNGKLCTIITARDYCGQFNNHGAFISIDQEFECRVQQLTSPSKTPDTEHPGVTPVNEAPAVSASTTGE